MLDKYGCSLGGCRDGNSSRVSRQKERPVVATCRQGCPGGSSAGSASGWRGWGRAVGRWQPAKPEAWQPDEGRMRGQRQAAATVARTLWIQAGHQQHASRRLRQAGGAVGAAFVDSYTLGRGRETAGEQHRGGPHVSLLQRRDDQPAQLRHVVGCTEILHYGEAAVVSVSVLRGGGVGSSERCRMWIAAVLELLRWLTLLPLLALAASCERLSAGRRRSGGAAAMWAGGPCPFEDTCTWWFCAAHGLLFLAQQCANWTAGAKCDAIVLSWLC